MLLDTGAVLQNITAYRGVAPQRAPCPSELRYEHQGLGGWRHVLLRRIRPEVHCWHRLHAAPVVPPGHANPRTGSSSREVPAARRRAEEQAERDAVDYTRPSRFVRGARMLVLDL